MIEIADVFRRFADGYLSAHDATILPSHRRAIADILACRTEALGGHLWRCDHCSAEVYSYHSCKNRSCPKCHTDQTEQWLGARKAEEQCSYVDYLAQLIEGETTLRENRSIERRIRNARFPVLKTLEEFQWSWPKKINRPQIQNLFRLAFIATQTNVVLIGNVGLGKTHLSIALGHAACLNGHTVLFTTAVDIINTLAAAQSAGRLKRELHRYLKPAVLIVDELGYLPIDKHGADLLFQIISQRYERAPMVITSNRAYKHWSQIFNNDSTLTSAILDRVLHHAETVIIEGTSFRMKDEIDA